MTKKDYELIAEAIANAKTRILFKAKIGHISDDVAAARIDGLNITADEIAEALALDNPKFLEDRFMAACGIDQ